MQSSVGKYLIERRFGSPDGKRHLNIWSRQHTGSSTMTEGREGRNLDGSTGTGPGHTRLGRGSARFRSGDESSWVRGEKYERVNELNKKDMIG